MKNVISHESSPVLTAPANEARGIRTRSGRLIRAVSSDINTCRTSRANSETHYRARRSKKRIVECIRNTTTANKRLRSMEVDDVSSSSDTEAMDLDTNAFRNERYYCPYEGCTMNLCRHSPLFFHIRREHDEDFPRFHGHSKRFFFKTPKGDVFRFTDESCKDTIKRGESIIVERLDTGKERYYCPYIGCAVSLSDHHGIYKHVRRNHDEDFPCFKEPSANFIFKQTNGDIICFTDERCRNTIDPSESIIIEREDNSKERYYCPYTGCATCLSARAILFHHIRRDHDANFYLFREASNKFFFKTPEGDTLRFTDESCKNTVDPGDSILVERVCNGEERYYCPYQGCVSSFSTRGPLFPHIRQNHDAAYPRFTISSDKFLYKTPIGNIFRFTDASCQNLIKSGESIIVEIIDKDKKRYYCPYDQCTLNSRTHLYCIFQHIRKIHDEAFPIFDKSYNKFLFKTPKGDTFHFSDVTCKNTIKYGESITIEKVSSDKERYYCPYERCTLDFSFRGSLFHHIRQRHDGDYPLFNSPCDKFRFKTPRGDSFLFTDEYCQNMLKRNESIVIEKVEVDNKDRYYCPYQQCERDYSGSPNLYSHIRECHDAGYDPFPTKRWKVFKTPKGEVINFKSETCRNMLMQSEVITVEYLKGKVRFYCPYEGCVRTFHNCRLLYCHIRDVHYEDYPSLNSGQRVSKAPNGDILHFDDENCRNVLKNGDTIIVEISECFFCPYQKCNYSCDSYTTLSNHIRKSHYAEFPCIRSSTRRCKTSDGKEINFNSESCRDMLKPDDVIIIEDLNRIDNFYCPYEGCLNSYVVISNLYVHIRREHYPDFPKLIQGRVPKTSHGDVIDWKSEGCRNMLKLGEKMVFDAEECELSYCPYKGCSVNCKSRISFVKHIRKYHCTDCPGLTSATRIYKTPNGDILELDKESCRDTLDHGDTIIAEDPNKITDRKYFYCPYQGCVFKLTERSKIYVHIRKNHYSELGKIVIPRPLCKTEQGDTLHLDSESCRNMLNSGDKILIEPINSEEARNFCPYKGCSKKSVQVGSIYEHIRRMHKQHLPKIGNCRRSAYGTAQGKIVTFDEECRDLLEEGEKLTVLRAPAINSGVSYCPYEGCSVSTNYRHLFGHIRNKHDREFRKLGPNPSISIYTGPLGNLILFDESSRGTVKEGERITVNDFRR